ncbi:DMT family transporter [Paenibacillus ginsengarvi]|uniref:EamA domain-containing protein n=1 Tax=Paenibacillus ginsengarvi TaxID=400777 RepID=A0A3B0CEU8_9BACL|nr:DMT family transporter [Paenibacillus ginsengarvi]RKN84012.1 hypothetical protein D7M11_15650 [Paenibacillus ginsengarvi]
MLGIAMLLVLGSGFIHSVWNLYTKRSRNKNVFLWYCQLIAVFAFLPWTILELDAVRWTGSAAALLAASMVLHGLYVLLLAAVYSIGDLSQVYPIMRGTSPLLVPLLGVFVLGETLSSIGWAGVALIVLGIVLVSDIRPGRSGGSSSRAPLLALAVGVCIAGYIIVDKKALEYIPAIVLNEASNIGNLLALSTVALRSGDMRAEWSANRNVIVLGGILAPAGYLLFLFALTLAPVALLAPMREIGTVFGAVLGVWVLRESQGRRRIWTSLLITAGVIVLGIWGGA